MAKGTVVPLKRSHDEPVVGGVFGSRILKARAITENGTRSQPGCHAGRRLSQRYALSQPYGCQADLISMDDPDYKHKVSLRSPYA